MSRTPHKLNVPGDFYVEDGCCTACDLPSTEAPGFFEFEISDNMHNPGSNSYHCYFCKQPQNKAETTLVLNAMMIQELDCIRYKGKDEAVLRRMAQEGMLECSDVDEAIGSSSDEQQKRTDDPKTLLSRILERLNIR